jgi:hypothetical protein
MEPREAHNGDKRDLHASLSHLSSSVLLSSSFFYWMVV